MSCMCLIIVSLGGRYRKILVGHGRGLSLNLSEIAWQTRSSMAGPPTSQIVCKDAKLFVYWLARCANVVRATAPTVVE